MDKLKTLYARLNSTPFGRAVCRALRVGLFTGLVAVLSVLSPEIRNAVKDNPTLAILVPALLAGLDKWLRARADEAETQDGALDLKHP